MRAGRHAKADFGFEPPTPSARVDDYDLPQRLAMGEPGWHRFLGRIRVLLDGADVARCTGFDADKGMVRVQKVDAEGRIYIDQATDRIATATLHGRVEVRWK